MISVTELGAGVVFEDRGPTSAKASSGKEYFLVLSYEHIKMGRGSGTVKVKVKSLETGSTTEKSFTTGARVQDASLERKKVQYLYRDTPTSATFDAKVFDPEAQTRRAMEVKEATAGKEGFHFMDPESYEQFMLPEKLIRDLAKYLKDGMEITLFTIDERPMYIETPKILEYTVTQTGGSARGNTVGASYKDAQLENGLMIKVPLFIKTGEIIRVDTRTGDYVERAK